MDDFAGREGAALVTGGTGAIGAAVVKLLAGRGSRVVFTYRSNAETASALTSEVGAEAAQLDVTDTEAAAAAVGGVDERFGGIHTVVYASGPFVPLDYLSRITPQQFRAQLDADAGAFFNVVQPAVERLRRTRGSVVAVTTTAVTRAVARDVLSSAPKSAVQAVVQALALEEGRFGVRANCVGVGMTSVGMAEDLIEQGAFGKSGLAAVTANIPLRRFGTAEEIAEAVCFLASDAAGFITGQTLNVDGGYTV
jgi:NAD(P)-dependent dehydrogenase (short-subunit alcohol dehydrogenase family)